MPHALRLTAAAVLIAPLFTACLAGDPSGPAAPPLSLIPGPAQVERHQDRFILTQASRLVCAPPDSSCRWIAGYFAQLVSKTRGFAPRKLATHSPQGVIQFRREGSGRPESYTLDVTPERVVISAPADAGLFYGAITLWQLAGTGSSARVEIPALHISDEPRFAWRGVLLDSARHFQSPAFVKSFIDEMARHKLNVLQWHLTDDQGWRIEIKRYPRLTKVGAWRPDGKGGRYGGYYTQAQIREIVAYAKKRNVTVVPEIEMPGHALAAIVAYPKLGSVANPPKLVSSDWGVFPYLYNVDEATFRFLDNVLTEVMTLFPSRYIHVGGDEAPKEQWNASPRIREMMAKLHLKDADALQAHFTARIGRFLRAHHRRLIGWDEILNADLSPDAAVTSWRTPDSADEAAKSGHDVVLSPSPTLYFDYCQSDRSGEPPCRGTEVALKDVYDFNPAGDAHFLGVQGSIWTERFDTADRLSYAAFPRMAALAEVAWSPREAHDWPSFLARLPAQMSRYRAFGTTYSESAFAVGINAGPLPQGARVSLSNQARFGTIHYTMDGTAPTVASPVYEAPLDVALPSSVTAAAFDRGRALTKPATAELTAATILRRASSEMPQCTNDLPLNVNAAGTTIMVNVMNPCWIYKGLDLAGVSALEFRVDHVPFNYQIGDDIKKIPLYPDATPEGQLEVHLDTCSGERLAVVPLSGNALRASLPARTGVHDLCLLMARRKVDPVWAIDWVQPVKE